MHTNREGSTLDAGMVLLLHLHQLEPGGQWVIRQRAAERNEERRH
jgi:hypothetical protein